MISLRLRADSGSATVEFIGLSVLLLLPAMYILIAISQLQAAGYAAVAAADQAAKTIGYTNHEADAEARAVKTVHLTAEDYELDPTQTSTAITCSNPSCTTPRSEEHTSELQSRGQLV